MKIKIPEQVFDLPEDGIFKIRFETVKEELEVPVVEEVPAEVAPEAVAEGIPEVAAPTEEVVTN